MKNLQIFSTNTKFYFLCIFLLLSITCAAGSVILSPQGNYTVFQSPNPAVFNCSGDGYVISWQLNGSSYNAEHRQRGILVFPNSPTGTLASASLHIPSGATNNNTRVTCSVIDSTFTSVQLSETSHLTIQDKGTASPMGTTSNTSSLASNAQSDIPRVQSLLATVSAGFVLWIWILIAMCFIYKHCCAVRAVDKQVCSYATQQEQSTVTLPNQNEISETKCYIDVQCNQIISIPAPCDKVTNTTQHPHGVECDSDDDENEICCIGLRSTNAKIKSSWSQECLQSDYSFSTYKQSVFAIAPSISRDVVKISSTTCILVHETTNNTQLPHCVECDSEDESETDSRWCQRPDSAQQATTAHNALGTDEVTKHAAVIEGQQILSEHIDHNVTRSSDLFSIKPFVHIQETDYLKSEGVACNGSPFFAFASTILPEFTKLSPTVLVCETMDAERNSMQDDKSHTDSTNVLQDDFSSVKREEIILKTATMEKNMHTTGPPLMTSTIKKITEKSTLLIQLSNMLPFDTTGKVPPHWSTPEQWPQKQSREVSVSRRYDYWLFKKRAQY